MHSIDSGRFNAKTQERKDFYVSLRLRAFALSVFAQNDKTSRFRY